MQQLEKMLKPLNQKRQKYFSLLCDGFSSATTYNEKELYLIKTCKNGKLQFDVLSLQQPDDTSGSGLYLNLKDSVRSANFSFEQRECMVGLGSDVMNANKCLYELEKEEIRRDHLVFTWCLSHKLELALQKSYTMGTQLEKDVQLQLANEYYLFKKVTLKWRLFDCYTEKLGQRASRYKRP